MRRRLALPLAVLLLFQWLAAYGHCSVRQATAPASFAICSAHVDAAPDPGKGVLVVNWDCPACHHVPFMDAVFRSPPGPGVVTWFVIASVPRRPDRSTLGPRAPPPPSRAPPLA